MPAKNPRPRDVNCAAACGRKAVLPYSKYCAHCAHNVQVNGSPFAAGIRTCKFRKYRSAVRAFVHRHRNSKAVQAAFTLAADVLRWSPTQEWTAHRKLWERLQVLAAHGVTDEDLVCRVLEFAFYEQDNPYRVQREMRMQLARSVLKLAPLRGYIVHGHPALLLADLILEDGLWGWAVVARMRIEQEAMTKAKVRKDLTDYGDA